MEQTGLGALDENGKGRKNALISSIPRRYQGGKRKKKKKKTEFKRLNDQERREGRAKAGVGIFIAREGGGCAERYRRLSVDECDRSFCNCWDGCGLRGQGAVQPIAGRRQNLAAGPRQKATLICFPWWEAVQRRWAVCPAKGG